MNLYNVIETIINSEKADNRRTTISICLQNNNKQAYLYNAQVDKNLNFRTSYSSFVGTAISPEEPDFQISIKKMGDP